MTEAWSQSPGLAFVDEGDRITIVNLVDLTAETLPVQLVDTGLTIWRAIDGIRSSQQIASLVGEDFPGSHVGDDVSAFIESLVQLGLVVPTA